MDGCFVDWMYFNSTKSGYFWKILVPFTDRLFLKARCNKQKDSKIVKKYFYRCMKYFWIFYINFEHSLVIYQ